MWAGKPDGGMPLEHAHRPGEQAGLARNPRKAIAPLSRFDIFRTPFRLRCERNVNNFLRQLFFVWQHNAFVYGSKPTTTV